MRLSLLLGYWVVIFARATRALRCVFTSFSGSLISCGVLDRAQCGTEMVGLLGVTEETPLVGCLQGKVSS
jgi:hypothetical protein